MNWNVRSSSASPKSVYDSIEQENSPVGGDIKGEADPITAYLLGRKIESSIASPEKNVSNRQEKTEGKNNVAEVFSLFGAGRISKKEYEQAAKALGKLLSEAKEELRPMYHEFYQHFSGNDLERAVKEKVFGFLDEAGPNSNDPVLRSFFENSDYSALKPVIDFIHGDMQSKTEPSPNEIKDLLDKMLGRSQAPSPTPSEEDYHF